MAARSRLAFLFLLSAALLSGAGSAEPLQRLHVQSFTLSSDTASPQVDMPFHVTLTIRIKERISRLYNVYLPAFSGAEELGDERETTQDANGTLYRETLILVAHGRTPVTVGSAYLDAIDARDGKPKRFISNGLSLDVGGGALPEIWGFLRATFVYVLELALLIVALFVVVTIFRRRKPAPPPPVAVAPPAAAAVPVPPSPEDALRAALDDLSVRRDRARVLRARAALWDLAGAREGETLADVLARSSAGNGRLRGLIIAVERASFIEDSQLDRAIEGVLSERERSL